MERLGDLLIAVGFKSPHKKRMRREKGAINAPYAWCTLCLIKYLKEVWVWAPTQ